MKRTENQPFRILRQIKCRNNIYKSFTLPCGFSAIIITETKGGCTMEKFIPYEKLSKKERKKHDQARRQTWGDLNPVTRKPVSSKAYNRKRTQDWKKELPDLRPVFFRI